MENKTFSVGSIVKVGSRKACIVGIAFDELNRQLVKCYMLVPYPVGYTDGESCRLARAEETELIYEGYRSGMSEAWIHFADHLEFAAKKADAETIRGYLKQIAVQQSGREV